MINAIRMDVSRVFKGKAFRITFLIWVFTMMFITLMNIKFNSTIPENAEYYGDTDYLYQDPSWEGDWYDNDYTKTPIHANIENLLSGGAILLFVGIFASIYVSKEKTSGFLKNISNHVPDRSTLIISQLIGMAVYNFTIFVGMYVGIGLVQLVMLGKIIVGSVGTTFKLLGLFYLMSLAFAAVIILLSVVCANDAAAISLSCILSSGFFTMIYQLISMLINKYTPAENFDLTKYTLTGNIVEVSEFMTDEKMVFIVILSLCYLVICTVLAGIVYKKKDVV